MKMSVPFRSACAPLLSLALLVSLSAGFSVSARAVELEVTFINDTQVSLQRLFASRVNLDTWGDDHLGSRVLEPGQEITINLDDGSGYCIFDVRGEFTDEDVVENYRVDICQTVRFRFTD